MMESSTVDDIKDERSYSMVKLLCPLFLSERTCINRYRFPKFTIIIIFGASVTVFLYYLSLEWVEDRSYGVAVIQGQQVRYLVESRPCSDVDEDCYIVYDSVDIFTGDVNRFLITGHAETKQETVVRLIPPTGISSEKSDSRFWKVNHTHISKHYVAVMLTMPFARAALALSNYANLAANVLIIGLGGGSMNMFLTNHFPKMLITVVELDQVVVDLARRWFGVQKKHGKMQVVTMDGIKFIEKAAAEKVLFNVVLIDVCDEFGDVICPSEPFMRPNFIENLEKILEPAGTVVLNILPREDILDHVDEIVRVYQKQFPTCAVASRLSEMNTILACQVEQRIDPNASRLMSQRFQEAWSHFGFIEQFGVMEVHLTFSKNRAERNS